MFKNNYSLIVFILIAVIAPVVFLWNKIRIL